MALLGPTRLLIIEKSATYTIKWSYTIIWQVRVSCLPDQHFFMCKQKEIVPSDLSIWYFDHFNKTFWYSSTWWCLKLDAEFLWAWKANFRGQNGWIIMAIFVHENYSFRVNFHWHFLGVFSWTFLLSFCGQSW